jgi:hypothetical protein
MSCWATTPLKLSAWRQKRQIIETIIVNEVTKVLTKASDLKLKVI